MVGREEGRRPLGGLGGPAGVVGGAASGFASGRGIESDSEGVASSPTGDSLTEAELGA